MGSPYDGVPVERWADVTRQLITAHPLDPDEVVEVVLICWADIFRTRIGGRLQIGTDLFPSPQILGSYLHELIPYEFETRYPGIWRRDAVASEKDLVYMPDQTFSVEIKCSSQKWIYGNRSFTQASTARAQKKEKSGYYLAVNFPPIHKLRYVTDLASIRFGWLDITDWQGQVAASGQQASLPKEVFFNKLLLLYPRSA